MNETGIRQSAAGPNVMAENGTVPLAVQVRGVTAEYSLGRTPTGEWFALGTVRDGTACLVVGTGPTETEAIDQLVQNLNDRYGTAR